MRENFPRATREKERDSEPGVPPEPVAGIARPLREERRPRIASEGGTFLLFRSSLPLFCSSLFSFSPWKTRGARFFLLFSPSAGGKRLFPDKNRNGLSWRPHSRESLPGEPVFPLSDAPPATASKAKGHSGSAKRQKKRGKAATGASSATGTFRRPGQKDGQKERQPKTTKAGEIVKKGQKGRETADQSIQDDKSR